MEEEEVLVLYMDQSDGTGFTTCELRGGRSRKGHTVTMTSYEVQQRTRYGENTYGIDCAG